ncbi:unnamed protein product [Lampetra fluviatilis]
MHSRNRPGIRSGCRARGSSILRRPTARTARPLTAAESFTKRGHADSQRLQSCHRHRHRHRRGRDERRGRGRQTRRRSAPCRRELSGHQPQDLVSAREQQLPI